MSRFSALHAVTVTVTGAVLLALTGCVDSGRSSSPAADQAGCPWTPDDSVTTTARLAWQPSPTGDLIVQDKGILEACMPKAHITWSQFASGADVVQAFGSNSVDLGLVGSSPAAKALSAPLNLPVQVVWIYEVIGDAESLVAHDPSINGIADLKGKTVAVPFGSTSHYSLLSALNGAGLRPTADVQLINMAPDAMLAAWQGGQVDAAWVWNPVLGELENAGGRRVFSSADTAKAGNPTFDLAIATTDFVDKNPKFMQQWAKAQDWAVTMIHDDPAKASESMAIRMGISPDQAGGQLKGYEYLAASDQASEEWLRGGLGDNLDGTAKFLLSQGSIAAVSSPEVYAKAVDAGPAGTVGK
ncbi:glycine/betaine ABC transporter substrate-binding protein [Mycolicibacterium moriokaense]|nr:glycine/betaine ABC transporter substrate-binding protein [Mycolicibacterium moriokaense]